MPSSTAGREVVVVQRDGTRVGNTVQLDLSIKGLGVCELKDGHCVDTNVDGRLTSHIFQHLQKDKYLGTLLDNINKNPEGPHAMNDYARLKELLIARCDIPMERPKR
jgi:hypothetical protein